MTAHKVDEVVVLDLGANPEPATPFPLLLQNDSHTLLGYNAIRPASNGPTTEAAGFAILAFEGCIASRFGYPNDEALHGHPLYERGLRHYRCHEVLRSTWLGEINRRNRVAFPTWSGYDLRHFAVTFIDATFECIAAGVSVELIANPSGSRLNLLVTRFPS